MVQDEEKILKILLDSAYITQEDIESAKKINGSKGLVDYFVKNEVLSYKLIDQAMSEFYGLEYMDIDAMDIQVDTKLLARIPEVLAKRYSLVCIFEDDKKVDLITAQPETISDATEELFKIFAGKSVNVKYVSPDQYQRLMSKFKKPLQDRFDQLTQKETFSAPDLFNEIISEAYNLRSSDIHFEPQPGKLVLIRFRIDGLLKEVGVVTYDVYEKVLNRVKVLAHLRIDQHYAPQDGSIRIDGEEYKLDLRISIIPVLEGEKIVIRVLSDYVKDLSLSEIGLSDRDQQLINESLKKKYGMILNSGPTGSGKTTTLYAILKTLQNPSVNITTIEDPVEYRIPGLNQIQVDPGNDVTFAKGLRSIVRQDPNVILVGEIRDEETAEIAVNAALTGHLVLSTFHANDAATSIPRLIDMGIEPFLLSSTLSLILAQRLVRRICPNCRVSKEVKRDDLKTILNKPQDFFPDKVFRMYYGKGCEKCNFTGYKGRMAIFQMIYVTDNIKPYIESSSSTAKLWEIAKKDGSKTFFEDGIEKVLLGYTTLEELIRVAPITSETVKNVNTDTIAKTTK